MTAVRVVVALGYAYVRVRFGVQQKPLLRLAVLFVAPNSDHDLAGCLFHSERQNASY